MSKNPGKLATLLIALTLIGCAAPPTKITPTPGAQTAEVNDSSIDSSEGAQPAMFVVDSIDGVSIVNALNRSWRMGGGIGAVVMPYLVARPVEAKPARFRLKGVHVFRVRIDELVASAAGKYRRIEGDVDFTPLAGKVYRVNGTLDTTPASIWIEDWETKERVSNIITTH